MQGGGSGVDPGILQAFANPMISSSPFLQNQVAQNPSGMTGALSPAAMSQLAQIYPALMGTAAPPSGSGQGGLPFPKLPRFEDGGPLFKRLLPPPNVSAGNATGSV